MFFTCKIFLLCYNKAPSVDAGGILPYMHAHGMAEKTLLLQFGFSTDLYKVWKSCEFCI